ncbi:lysozyme inhibitor LprI family protein [Pseudomonas sp. MWU13-2105]|uniref:lysozyme inhibitor LprI family protein n=1 Tax=Pseudomonas sp. MWU13-2105 TaxID=2935074 RepID=UPI00200EBBCC|nr:lysozyme inhibitor LprI family protein [Pseudomonas sp. MWU13-2105]
MKYPLIAFLTVSLLGLAAGAQAADNCDANQASMNECAGKEFKQADDDLNRYYKTQMDYLKTPANKAALKDAQRKWLAFRDADCLYRNGKPADGGSIWPLLDLQCKTELTRQRAAQLKAYTECRDETNGCRN